MVERLPTRSEMAIRGDTRDIWGHGYMALFIKLESA